ncbi:hypothetical protein IW262DRAFT_1419792 [Armillaria fumosa]|nr:hypothetical protein IW262DRAFT_1419792 [Armillaria fumosa]
MVFNNLTGIRTHPYSTNASVNPLRYSSIPQLYEFHYMSEDCSATFTPCSSRCTDSLQQRWTTLLARKATSSSFVSSSTRFLQLCNSIRHVETN